MSTKNKTPVKSLKGFASNPQGINRAGRPKGSRNKSTLLKAQLLMDSSTEYAAEFYDALMRNDTDFLGITTDVPLSIRLASAKEVMNKTIANESSKEPSASLTKQEQEDETPLFSSTPVAKAS